MNVKVIKSDIDYVEADIRRFFRELDYEIEEDDILGYKINHLSQVLIDTSNYFCVITTIIWEEI